MTQSSNESQLKARIAEFCGREVDGPLAIFEDTSSYTAIGSGSVLRLEDSEYYVRGEMSEGRFGIDDQPKFWVKHAVDLSNGEAKIIKMIFHEEFSTTAAGIRIRCRRSAAKESAVLDLVRGHRRFMQGVTLRDPLGSEVRVIDFIRGKSLYNYVNDLEISHERYHAELFPGVMAEVVACIEAMAELHRRGQHHGDVRNDHILIERETGAYVWIDFDYQVNFSDFDVWSMGNIVNFVVGMGVNTFYWVTRYPKSFPHLRGSIDGAGAVALFPNRIAELKLLYPYISADLNEILMRFSVEHDAPYETLDELARDLRSVLCLDTDDRAETA